MHAPRMLISTLAVTLFAPHFMPSPPLGARLARADGPGATERPAPRRHTQPPTAAPQRAPRKWKPALLTSIMLMLAGGAYVAVGGWLVAQDCSAAGCDLGIRGVVGEYTAALGGLAAVAGLSLLPVAIVRRSQSLKWQNDAALGLRVVF